MATTRSAEHRGTRQERANESALVMQLTEAFVGTHQTKGKCYYHSEKELIERFVQTGDGLNCSLPAAPPNEYDTVIKGNTWEIT